MVSRARISLRLGQNVRTDELRCMKFFLNNLSFDIFKSRTQNADEWSILALLNDALATNAITSDSDRDIAEID